MIYEGVNIFVLECSICEGWGRVRRLFAGDFGLILGNSRRIPAFSGTFIRAYVKCLCQARKCQICWFFARMSAHDQHVSVIWAFGFIAWPSGRLALWLILAFYKTYVLCQQGYKRFWSVPMQATKSEFLSIYDVHERVWSVRIDHLTAIDIRYFPVLS